MVTRILGLIVLIGLSLAGWLAFDYWRFLATPLSIPERGTQWRLENGRSYRAMVGDLSRAGLTEGGWHWRVLGATHDSTRQLQAGTYQLEAGLTPEALIEQLSEGDVISFPFTIVEGWNVRELCAALAREERLQRELAACDVSSLASQLNIEGEHAEGWFLPETYLFAIGESDKDILERAYKAMLAELERLWAMRADNLPYDNSADALIMASIIEKETGAAHERPQIAGVFVRRLDKGMRLQTDPTVIYGMGEAYNGNITRRDLVTDTPYNTYTRAGLPPTPIALPGTDAIAAALNPEDGDAIFFVSRGDGTHVFSSNLADHNRAVNEFQRKKRPSS